MKTFLLSTKLNNEFGSPCADPPPVIILTKITWARRWPEAPKGRNCRQVTPHLGYLTNWHSRIKSVKNSLSNTLSERPDHQRRLCGKIKKQQATQTWSKLSNVLLYLPACSRGSAQIFSFSFSFASSTEVLLSSCGDDRVSGWSVWPLSHGAAKRKSKQEDNCEVSAQEICGNKVSTCHSCEMLLKALGASQLLR